MGLPDFPSVNLNQLLSVQNLPAMPQSAIRILEISKDPTCSGADLAVPIEADPGLTMQVLKFVNSSYFGFRQQISSVKQAISLVGMRTIRNFALWNAVFSLIPNPKCGNFDLSKLWQDSLRRAIFARSVTKSLGRDDGEEAFAAALLQDMAVPLLAKEVPDAYERLLTARHASPKAVRLSQLEDHVFGWTHAEAAGIIARQWDLPDSLALLMEEHTDIQHGLTESGSNPSRAAVAMSAFLPSTSDSVWKEHEQFVDYYNSVKPTKAPTIEELLNNIDSEFSDFAPMLKISTPPVSLTQSHEESRKIQSGPASEST